jgi:hypothetical protein
MASSGGGSGGLVARQGRGQRGFDKAVGRDARETDSDGNTIRHGADGMVSEKPWLIDIVIAATLQMDMVFMFIFLFFVIFC